MLASKQPTSIKHFAYFVDQSLQASETARPSDESNDNDNVTVIVTATSAVASILIIAVAILVGYALKLRSRRLESNTNTPHRYINTKIRISITSKVII